MIRSKRFREDLFYRLNVVTISTPSLREIPEDIPILVHHLARRVCGELEMEPIGIATGVLEDLMAREWPGNVRQLQNFVRRLIVFSNGREIGMADLKAVDNQDMAEERFERQRQSGAPGGGDGALDSSGGTPEPYTEAKNRVVNEFTEEYVRKILSLTGGNISHGAKLAGMSRVALQKILRRLDIDPETYRTN